jgi:hypothetical protein
MSLIPATTPRGTDPRESWMQTAVAPLPLWPIQASTGGGQFHLGIDLTEYPDKFIIHAGIMLEYRVIVNDALNVSL